MSLKSFFVRKPAAGLDIAGVVGYARSEFRDGHSEKEVLALLAKAGHGESIHGVVRELYFECLGVTLIDRALEMLAKIIGLPVAITVFFIGERTWKNGFLLLLAIGMYFSLVPVWFRRHWEKRFRRRMAKRAERSGEYVQLDQE